MAELARLSSRPGRLEEAQELCGQAVALLRQAGDWWGEAYSLITLAIVHQYRGQPEVARELCRQALALFGQRSDRVEHGVLLYHAAWLHQSAGRLDDAQALYEQALDLARQLGDQRGEIYNLGKLALMHHAQGRPAQALHLCGQALPLSRQVGDRANEGWLLLIRSRLERHGAGDTEKALHLVEAAEALLICVGDQRVLVQVLCDRAFVQLARGESARELLHRAQQLVQDFGLGPESPPSAWVGRLCHAQEAFEAGRPLFRGEYWADIPAGLRQWLIRTGRAGEPFASLEAAIAGERGEERERLRAGRAAHQRS
jgi:tetratricopeptide (TPR) repeat protein